jgi:hypothetical protein
LFVPWSLFSSFKNALSENQVVLPGQPLQCLRKRVTGPIKFFGDPFGRNAMLHGWTAWRVGFEVDNGKPPLGSQRRFQLSEIFRPVAYVVISVDDQNNIDGFTTVVRNDLRRRGGNPTLIAGYGAYGVSMRPTFTPSCVSLL